MQIYIIRHGETKSNAEGRLQGQTDHPLNENGVALAIETGKNMQGIHFDKCFSSPLVRAKHTAELVLQNSGNENTPMEFDDRIMEINMGDMEGKVVRGAHTEVPVEMREVFYKAPDRLGSFPNGESAADVRTRTQAFLKELASKEGEWETVLVATHGFAMRCMLNFLYENPTDFWQGHVPYNCAVNHLEVKNGVLRIVEPEKIYYDEKAVKDLFKFS